MTTPTSRVGFALFAFGLIGIGASYCAVQRDGKPDRQGRNPAALEQSLQRWLAQDHAKLSPFSAVRWRDSWPEVKVGAEWFELVSLNDLTAREIVAFSKRTHEGEWRMRFEQDLVELLTDMGHPPERGVKLVLLSLESSETSVLEDVPMTEANRRAIRAAAGSRTKPEPPRDHARRAAVPIEDSERFRARIDEFLHAARLGAGFSGAVIVARGGKPDYEGTFGFSHLASRTPNSLDTPFRIASLSKQFTATAVLLLEADGKLEVDDLVHGHLREFNKGPFRGITIHQLLTHTSGLPRVPEDARRRARWQAMSQAATPVDDYVQLACEVSLKFEPGQDFEYSNFGYRILSAVVARVTKQEYADFMEERVFQPLGLENTGVARVSRPRHESRVADGLQFLGVDPETDEPRYEKGDRGRNYGAGHGSGGIYSSANDLLEWDRVLADNRFLPEKQTATLFQPVEQDYACGWTVRESGLDGRLYQTHSGANEGFFSKMMRIPADDLVIIAVGNVAITDELDEALEQLFRLCRSLPYGDPWPR